MRESLKSLDPLHSCPQCEGFSPMAKSVGARCSAVTATDRFRKRAREKLKKKRMRTTDAEFTQLVTDYGRISRRLSTNGDTIGRDWPARVALLAEVVLDARNRVEMKALGDK